MKTIKFAPHLVQRILSGEKKSTWRLFDDKNLSEGDLLSFMNSETKEVFAKAKVTRVKSTKLGLVNEEDFQGNSPYSSKEEMYKRYSELYKRKADKDSELKIISFELIKN